MYFIAILSALVSHALALGCSTNSCISQDMIGVCTNSTMITMSCDRDIQLGSYCTETVEDYEHHCSFAGIDFVGAESLACSKDTCSDTTPYVLNRCFGGMVYPTNCNQVLNTNVGGALCYPSLGINEAAVCDYTSHHTKSTTYADIQCSSPYRDTSNENAADGSHSVAVESRKKVTSTARITIIHKHE